MTTRLNDTYVAAVAKKILADKYPGLSDSQRGRIVTAALEKQSDACRDREEYRGLATNEWALEADINAIIRSDPEAFVPPPSAEAVFAAETQARAALGIQALPAADRLTRARQLAAASPDELVSAMREANAAVTAKGGTPAAPEAKPLPPALDRDAKAEAEARAQLAAAGVDHPSGVRLRSHVDSIKERMARDDRDAALARSLEFKLNSGNASPADKLTLARLRAL